MIQEASDTLLNLRTLLERIRDKQTDIVSGWVALNNNARVNGIEDDIEIEKACAAFIRAAAIYTGEGNPMRTALQDENWHRTAFENAMAKLLEYRTALRAARGREDARIIRSVNENEVSDPF